MTIASAFNDIAIAQGGTASTSGTIAGAIDALNDALAGSDQKAAQTIEDAVRLLGQNIGGGGGSVEHSITCYAFDSQTHERVSVDGRICSAEIDDGVYDITETEIQTAYAGTVLCAGMFTQDNVSYTPLGYGTESASIGELTGSEAYFVMPNENCEVFYTSI